MAERLVISIDGDSTGLTKSLQSAGNRLNTFNTRVTNSSRNLTNFQKKLSSLSSSVTTAAAANAKLATNIDVLVTKLASINTASVKTAQGMRAATREASLFSNSLRTVSSTIASVRTLLFAGGLIFGGVVSSIIDANSRMERMQVMLKGLQKTGDDAQRSLAANKDIEYIWDLADNAPFKIDALSEAFIKFKANGIDPTNGSLKSVIDAVSAFGGTTDNLKSATLAITQMMSKGVLSMEELRQQLADSGGIPDAVRLIARGLGYADNQMAKFYKDVSKGSISSAKALTALFNELQKAHNGAAAKMMNTWSGLTSRMQNAWQKFVVRISMESGENSFFKTIENQVSKFTTFLNSKAGDEFAKDINKLLSNIVLAISKVIEVVYKYREQIVEIGKVFFELWASEKIINAIRVISTAVATFGLNLGTTIEYFAKFKTAQTALEITTGVFSSLIKTTELFKSLAGAATMFDRSLLLFGPAFTDLAMGMGLFTASGGIALGVLAAWTAGIAAAVAGVGALVYIIYQWNKEQGLTDEQQKKLNESNKVGKNLYDQLEQAINDVTFASEKERQEQIASKKAILEKTQAYINAAKAAIAYQQAQLGALNADISRDEELTKQAQVKHSTTALAIGGNIGNLVYELFGRKMDEAGLDRLKNRRDYAQQRIQDQKDRLSQYQKQADQLMSTIKSLEGIKVPGVDQLPTSTHHKKTEAEKEQEKRDRLFERMKQQYINQQTSLLGKEYEKAKGTTEGFDTEDAQESAERSFDALVKKWGISPDGKNIPQRAIDALRASINRLKDDNREASIDIKRQNVIKALNADAQEQKDKAESLWQTYIAGFDLVSRKVDDFVAANQKKYADDLEAAKNNKEAMDQINKAMEDDNNNFRAGTLIQAATDIQTKNKEIVQSLQTQDEVRRENYKNEVAYVNDLLAQLSKLHGFDLERNKLVADLQTYLANLERKNKIDNAGPLAGWAEDAKSLSYNLKEGLGDAFTGFFDDLAQGQLHFAKFAESLIKDLGAIIIKALFAKAILNALGLGSGITAGISTTAATASSLNQSSLGVIGANPGIFHTGGIVGETINPSRDVSADLFKFAKRYHSGGFPGLNSNEVPIIAKKGEGIFTPEQMKALGSSASNVGASAAPEVNIINQTGSAVSKDNVNTKFDGEKWVVDIVLKNANKPGPMRDLLIGRK